MTMGTDALARIRTAVVKSGVIQPTAAPQESDPAVVYANARVQVRQVAPDAVRVTSVAPREPVSGLATFPPEGGVVISEGAILALAEDDERPVIFPDEGEGAENGEMSDEGVYDDLAEALAEAVQGAITATLASFARAGAPLPRRAARLAPQVPVRPVQTAQASSVAGVRPAQGAAIKLDYASIQKAADGSHEPTPCVGGCGVYLTKGFRCKACRKARREVAN